MVDGGDVHKIFRKDCSIPVICIDNNLVFKSISDASMWSGYTALTIKKSFNKKHEIDSNPQKLIFRPLTYVKYHEKLCIICGSNFKPKNNVQKMCKRCSTAKGKTKLILDHDFNKSYSTGIETYKLTDSWVKKKIIYYNENKIKYKYINKKKPSKIHKRKKYKKRTVHKEESHESN